MRDRPHPDGQRTVDDVRLPGDRSGSGGPNDPPAPQFNEYVVVLRARSAPRFAGGRLRVQHRGTGPSSRPCASPDIHGEAAPGYALPRELIVEVRGPAPSLDEAVMKFATIARPIATMAGFVANVQVGLLEVHLACDCAPDHDNRNLSKLSSRPNRRSRRGPRNSSSIASAKDHSMANLELALH